MWSVSGVNKINFSWENGVTRDFNVMWMAYKLMHIIDVDIGK